MDINSTELRLNIVCIDGKVQFASSKYEIVRNIVILIINVMNPLLGTLANGLVITAYYRNPRLRTIIQNVILCLLAIVDTTVTAVVEPLFATAIIRGLLEKRDCIIWDITVILSWFFLGLSSCTIAILSIQSYITLAYPYQFQSIITKRRLAIIVVLCLFITATGTLASAIFKYIELGSYICISVLSVTILVVVCTWIWTYKLISRHRRVIQVTQTPAEHKCVKKKKLLRSTVTAFLVTIRLIVCYCFAILLCLSTLISAWKVQENINWSFCEVASTAMYLNSSLNPCLVFWRSKDFRKTVKDIFTGGQT